MKGIFSDTCIGNEFNWVFLRSSCFIWRCSETLAFGSEMFGSSVCFVVLYASGKVNCLCGVFRSVLIASWSRRKFSMMFKPFSFS